VWLVECVSRDNNYQFVLSQTLDGFLSFRIDELTFLQLVGLQFITLLMTHKHITNNNETRKRRTVDEVY